MATPKLGGASAGGRPGPRPSYLPALVRAGDRSYHQHGASDDSRSRRLSARASPGAVSGAWQPRYGAAGATDAGAHFGEFGRSVGNGPRDLVGAAARLPGCRYFRSCNGASTNPNRRPSISRSAGNSLRCGRRVSWPPAPGTWFTISTATPGAGICRGATIGRCDLKAKPDKKCWRANSNLCSNTRHPGGRRCSPFPRPINYLPSLYVLATMQRGEEITFPVEGTDGGSISMLAVSVGGAETGG